MRVTNILGSAAGLLAAFAAAAIASAEYYREVRSGPLNVRANPSRSARVVRTLKTGARVLVERKQGSWARISKPAWGWVYAAYLQPRYRYTKDALNVRQAPSKQSRILRVLKRGTRVSVEKFGKTWAKIHAPVPGWVMKKYIGKHKPGSGGGTVNLGARSAAGFVNLPGGGYGYTTYIGAYGRWGVPRLVSGLISMARRWRNGYPGVSGRHLNFGDISLQNGGYFYPHQTHRDGHAVDMLPVSTSGSAAGVVVGGWGYSTYYTQKLANLHRSVWSVSFILHNNSRMYGVRYYPGHDNHLHTAIN